MSSEVAESSAATAAATLTKSESEPVKEVVEETKALETKEEETGNDGKENGESEMPSDFDLERLLKSFQDCVDAEGRILLSHYIVGYEELYKFLNLLGTVFGWVSTDVDAKLNILRDLRKSETSQNYQDVSTMLKYEVDNKLIKYKAKDSKTGSRNLLRLHRALEYIVAFLEEVPNLDTNDKCCGISQNAYKATLMKFHPWVVQKAASLAMNLLPTKAGLIEKICGDDEVKIARAHEALPAAVKAMQDTYKKTEEIYLQFELLNLP